MRGVPRATCSGGPRRGWHRCSPTCASWGSCRSLNRPGPRPRPSTSSSTTAPISWRSGALLPRRWRATSMLELCSSRRDPRFRVLVSTCSARRRCSTSSSVSAGSAAPVRLVPSRRGCGRSCASVTSRAGRRRPSVMPFPRSPPGGSARFRGRSSLLCWLGYSRAVTDGRASAGGTSPCSCY